MKENPTPRKGLWETKKYDSIWIVFFCSFIIPFLSNHSMWFFLSKLWLCWNELRLKNNVVASTLTPDGLDTTMCTLWQTLETAAASLNRLWSSSMAYLLIERKFKPSLKFIQYRPSRILFTQTSCFGHYKLEKIIISAFWVLNPWPSASQLTAKTQRLNKMNNFSFQSFGTAECPYL